MAELYGLTEGDAALFREMAADYRARRRSSGRSTGPIATAQAPEVYLAKVPPGGIPGLDQAGTTGTGTESPLDDVPGRAVCAIYQLMTMETDAPTFGRVGDLTAVVWNLSPTDILPNETPWVAIARDKFGEWIVTSAGGAAEGTDFEEFVETVEVVTAVVSRECGLTIRKTPFTFTFRLPVGSDVSVAVGSGNTGTGTADDGDDVLIDYPTKLIRVPSSASFAFDAVTCQGTITFSHETICVFSGGVECCPDYTGTGTS